MTSDAANPPQVQVNFALDISWGQLRISTQVPAERVDLVQILPALKDVTSSITSAVAGVLEQNGRLVSCEAGLRCLLPANGPSVTVRNGRTRELGPHLAS